MIGEFLQLIGSVASIVGVPLAIYLFLKGQVQKYANVRRDIVKRLSYQIGEGRKISSFELNAVIDSIVRENRLKKGSIPPSSVIEDLIAETVSSPLLESTRKNELVMELHEVHSLGKVYSALETDEELFQKFLSFLDAQPGEKEKAEALKSEIEKRKVVSAESSKVPEVFAVVASFIALLATGFSITGFVEKVELIPKLFNSELVTSMLMGVASSVIAALIAYIFSKRTGERR